jgi:hypothetical protein
VGLLVIQWISPEVTTTIMRGIKRQDICTSHVSLCFFTRFAMYIKKGNCSVVFFPTSNLI